MNIKATMSSVVCAVSLLGLSACTEDNQIESDSAVEYYLYEEDPGPVFWEAEKQTDLENFEKARELFLRSCEEGTGGSCAVLGIMLVNGEGGEVDSDEACRYFRKSCTMGYAQACRGVASFLEDGMCGGPKPSESEKLYRIACEVGDPDGCIGLGDFYKAGSGEKVDLDAAREFYGRACIAEENDDCDRYVTSKLEESGGE